MYKRWRFKYKNRTIFFFRMAIIAVVTALLMSFIFPTITTTTLPTNKKPHLTSVIGICTKIGTFHISSIENPSEGGSIKMLTQEYTKVRWKVSEGRIVVKFKVGQSLAEFGRNNGKCRRRPLLEEGSADTECQIERESTR